MTRKQQKAFVRELVRNVSREVIGQIDSGKLPEQWDGHELRELLAINFDLCRSTLMHEKRGAGRARLRAFRNEMLYRNL